MPDTETLSVAAVICDLAIDTLLDYSIPKSLLGTLLPGMRVKVAVRGKVRSATVFETKEKSAFPNLQPILELLGEKPFLPPDLFSLAQFISHYYCCPLHKVLKTILPPSIRNTVKPKEQSFITSSLSANELCSYCEEQRLKHPSHASVLDVMLKHPKGILLTRLLELSSATRSHIATLIKKNVLISQKIRALPLLDQEYFPTKRKVLTEEQKKILELIEHSMQDNIFQTRLIHGITGSGKTEVYLQAIEQALRLDKGVIFLVPEIALTSQTIERLKGRFKEKIAILHHRLSAGERFDAWNQIREGNAPIVVGARSAIFSPVPNLGLILVDEEHESSYKQSDEAPHYHARDVAVMRGKLCNGVVVLGSATPSLESFYNAMKGKYVLDTLKNRADHATLPTVHVIDMNKEREKNKGFTLFSDPLVRAIKKRIEIGEQTLLFLNRRGYHSAQMCLQCKHTLQCPHCDTNLTFHLNDNVLACHLCDFRLSPPPRCCPKCRSEGEFKFRGAGTEMVERALHAIFENVRTLRVDADTTRHKGSHESLFKQFKAGKADVLIGTQMIAKGLHFPSVTLVGVLNADTSLQIPDFRASEHVFQLLTQVAGRSGRGALSGEVLIQTNLPEHPIIALAQEQNYADFFQMELKTRELFSYPPFSHLVKLLASGEEERTTQEYLQFVRENLVRALPPSFHFFPVVPCGHARVKARFRFQFLIKAEKLTPLLPHLMALNSDKKPGGTRLSIDVDPLSTFF